MSNSDNLSSSECTFIIVNISVNSDNVSSSEWTIIVAAYFNSSSDRSLAVIA